jgi:hypothetical protein
MGHQGELNSLSLFTGQLRSRALMAKGDQPWDRTTFSRTSAERYDHTSSLVG